MGPPRKPSVDSRQERFFDLTPLPEDPELKALPRPLWTENKAKLIERYLYYFVQITKHGTYIDAFAGPQQAKDGEDMWAAKLVLESRPRWLRTFLLCEKNARKVKALQRLVASQPVRERKEPKRTVVVEDPGDCNVIIPRWLKDGLVHPRQAAFCLLDQRTFECEWKTVEALARYKSGRKIELFYFLGTSWLQRALSGVTRNPQMVDRWWGRRDWREVFDQKRDSYGLANIFVERFRQLGYASVKPWAIFETPIGGKIMYFMIHATDHPEAPKLMYRAYDRVGLPLDETDTQIGLFLNDQAGPEAGN
jgi:three-Cys-motif partner protein